MKVLVLLWVVSWGGWISMVQPQAVNPIQSVRFTTENATRTSYLNFMQDLYSALTEGADKSGKIPILPPHSALPAEGPQRYVEVDVSNGVQKIEFVLDVSNVKMLGYRPGGNARSYIFKEVPEEVRDVLFPGTIREWLPFSGNYSELEAVAGVGDRREIALGIDELNRHIYYLRSTSPGKASGHGLIATALIVCIQMISEAVRLRNIQQQILAVANPLALGTYALFYPDNFTIEYQTKWEDISTAVQSATFGIFVNPVRFTSDGQEVVLTTEREVVFTIAMMPLKCSSPEANPQLLRLPTEPTGVEDSNDICDRVLEPTSHIMGRNGTCLDVYESLFVDDTEVTLYPCRQNQINQLWTLGAGNTIRCGGKCLTTKGTAAGNNMVIFDCNGDSSDNNKWEIRSDGSIVNPKSGLFLTADEKGNLMLEENIYGSKQAFYAANTTTPPAIKLVGYEGKCLHACDDYVFLKMCKSNVTNQVWRIYPDETIRPERNQGMCLKYGNLEDTTVTIDACDGLSDDRWRFQSTGTILHVASKMVMDVVTDFGDITASPDIGAVTQIWFHIQP